MRRARAVLLLAMTFSMLACGSATEVEGTTTTKATTNTEGDGASGLPCAAARTDCTSAEVVATVEILYGFAGATAAEARCLAPVTGEAKHAVSEAFEAPTEAETQAAIACVGSEDRLRAIADSMAAYFAEHPSG